MATFEPPFASAHCERRHGATRGVGLSLAVNEAGRLGVYLCLIINGHMSCGLRFRPRRKHSSPGLAVMPTLKLAAAPKKQAMIPWRTTGALLRRRSPEGRLGARLCSTSYCLERETRRL